MDFKNDNKIENYFFSEIVKNKQLNSEILKIIDLIKEQKISNNDRIKIFYKFFGDGMINEKDEIESFLISIREKNNLDNKLLYKFIFLLIEEVLDIDDEISIDFIMANLSEDLETDFIYFFRDVFELVYVKLDNFFTDNKDLFENFSNDYIDEGELNKLLSNISKLFNGLLLEVKTSEEIKKIKNKISNWLKNRNTIFKIK